MICNVQDGRSIDHSHLRYLICPWMMEIHYIVSIYVRIGKGGETQKLEVGSINVLLDLHRMQLSHFYQLSAVCLCHPVKSQPHNIASPKAYGPYIDSSRSVCVWTQ